MTSVFDILSDEDFDLAIEHGDFVVGESTLQHQALLLLSNKGAWRQTPALGVGINQHLLSDDNQDLLRQEIRKEFERDGMKVGLIDFTEENLPLLQANYE